MKIKTSKANPQAQLAVRCSASLDRRIVQCHSAFVGYVKACRHLANVPPIAKLNQNVMRSIGLCAEALRYLIWWVPVFFRFDNFKYRVMLRCEIGSLKLRYLRNECLILLLQCRDLLLQQFFEWCHRDDVARRSNAPDELPPPAKH